MNKVTNVNFVRSELSKASTTTVVFWCAIAITLLANIVSLCVALA